MSDDRVTSEQRAAVIERASGCCEYCWSQARFATQAFSVEHIVPRSKGGMTTLDNLALSCQGCNNHKYTHTTARDPVSGHIVPLYHPRQHQWREHFAWNDDYSLLIGLTPIGRAAVEVLRLNREGVRNLRRVLYAVGEHPPKMLEGETG
jgi:hypothetical protein